MGKPHNKKNQPTTPSPTKYNIKTLRQLALEKKLPIHEINAALRTLNDKYVETGIAYVCLTCHRNHIINKYINTDGLRKHIRAEALKEQKTKNGYKPIHSHLDASLASTTLSRILLSLLDYIYFHVKQSQKLQSSEYCFNPIKVLIDWREEIKPDEDQDALTDQLKPVGEADLEIIGSENIQEPNSDLNQYLNGISSFYEANKAPKTAGSQPSEEDRASQSSEPSHTDIRSATTMDTCSTFSPTNC